MVPQKLGARVAGQTGKELGFALRTDRHWKDSVSGSRPKLQWCFQTRSKAWSQVPCTKQWLRSGAPSRTDSD